MSLASDWNISKESQTNTKNDYCLNDANRIICIHFFCENDGYVYWVGFKEKTNSMQAFVIPQYHLFLGEFFAKLGILWQLLIVVNKQQSSIYYHSFFPKECHSVFFSLFIFGSIIFFLHQRWISQTNLADIVHYFGI